MLKSMLLALLCSAAATAAIAQTPVEAASVSVAVTGRGQVIAVPDIAIISGNLTRQGKDSAVLLEQVSATMTQVIAALKREKIAKADIQAGQVRINQHWERSKGRNEPNGYNAQRPVAVTVRDFEAYPRIIRAMTEAGVNTLNDVRFDFSKRQQLSDQALVKATEDASRQAQLLAGALDAGNCRAAQISTSAHQVPMLRMAMADRAEAGSAYNPGEQKIEVTVSATFNCPLR